MHSANAHLQRKSLTLNQLERLRAQLVDEVERYKVAIRGYSPEKMAQYGAPYLAMLESRVADVDAEIAGRGAPPP